MSAQTFQIIATPADRFAVAVFLLHKDLKFKGKRRTGLYRLRNALGLMAPTETLLGERKGRIPLAFDKHTKNVFEVTTENAEFLNECLESVELSGAQLSSLEPVLSQLDERKASGPTADLIPYREADEDWAPSSAPLMEEPDRYMEINAELLKNSAGDFGRYIQLYLKEAEPVKAEAPNGAVAQLTAPPA